MPREEILRNMNMTEADVRNDDNGDYVIVEAEQEHDNGELSIGRSKFYIPERSRRLKVRSDSVSEVITIKK